MLGDGPALVLRGNGGLAVGASLEEAPCGPGAWRTGAVALAWMQAGLGRPFTDTERAARARWYPAEGERLWRRLVNRLRRRRPHCLTNGRPRARGTRPLRAANA